MHVDATVALIAVTTSSVGFKTDLAICERCGTDLLIAEATFCPMCGQSRDPGLSSSTVASDPLPSAVVDRRADHLMSPDLRPAADSPDVVDPPTSSGVAPDPVVELPAEDGVPGDYSREPGARLWRLGRGDLLAGGSSVVLLACQLLPWFSGSRRSTVAGLRIAVPTHVDAFGAGGWHWITVLLTLGLLGYLGARTYPGNGRHIPLPHWQLVASVTWINLFIAVLGILMPPDGGHWSLDYGALIALLAAICAVGGALVRRGEPELMSPPPPSPPEEATHEPEPLPRIDEERPARHRARTERRPERGPVRRPEHRAPLHSARSRATARRQDGAEGELGEEQVARRGTYEPTGTMCMICGGENPESRRVCKTCGVSLLSRGR